MILHAAAGRVRHGEAGRGGPMRVAWSAARLACHGPRCIVSVLGLDVVAQGGNRRHNYSPKGLARGMAADEGPLRQGPLTHSQPAMCTLVCRGDLCAGGDFQGSARVPGFGDLLHVANNLRLPGGVAGARWWRRHGPARARGPAHRPHAAGDARQQSSAPPASQSVCVCVCVCAW